MHHKLNLGVLLLASIITYVVLSQTGCQPGQPSASSAPVPKADRKYVLHYTGDVAIPDDLLVAYNGFADAAKSSDTDRISQSVLPHAVRIRVWMEAAVTEKAEDICLWRLGDKFAPDIMVVRKDAADCYLIRTASSATSWVKTESMGWRLYHYLDKPIM